MAYIDNNDNNPLAKYTNGMLHFYAPNCSMPSQAVNTDLYSSDGSLFDIGAISISGVGYAFNKSLIEGFDEYDYFDNTVRAAPYASGPVSIRMDVANAINTMYLNYVTGRSFKEGVVVGKDISVSFGYYILNNKTASFRSRFHASIIDSAGNETSIGTSGWSSNIIQGQNRTKLMNLVSGSGLTISGTDKKLLIKIEAELTHDGSTTSDTCFFYSDYITYNEPHRDGVYIACSVE